MSQIYATKRKSAAPAAQGKAAENISKSEMLRMSGAGAPQPMSPALREKFEPGFGADFSNIRISRGHIPEEMGVQAVAKGTDILIDSRAGMDVLGHELAHVVQQAQGQVQGGFPVVHDAALEHQADVMGARAASGMSAVEGGMGGFGGEMMSIAPMSGAEAPAQCKSTKDKNKPAKSRGDLFREDYASRDLAGQVELLREYSHVSSKANAEDQGEEDAYMEILSKASPQLVDEIMRQRQQSAEMMIARNETNKLYAGDDEKARFLTGTSDASDHFQSFGILMKNMALGGQNDDMYEYFQKKDAEMMASDENYKNTLMNADKLVTGSSRTNAWGRENEETADILRQQERERHLADSDNWNASRKAMLAQQAGKKKHHFRRWLNK